MDTAEHEEEIVPIGCGDDIVKARQKGRELASKIGFSTTDSVLITTAISELARNIVLYARSGEIRLGYAKNHHAEGIVVVAKDEGPGIGDVEQALRDGYSTSGSLGLGLPGVRRLMDELEIESHPGEGTIVTASKWKR